jgi:uncharacterized protein (TIGR02145 family)
MKNANENEEYEKYLEEVKENGLALENVPEALKTAEMCMAAVENEGLALGDVPEALKTAEMCMAAVKNDGLALDFAPEALKTLELCIAAVKLDCDAIEYVPDALKEKTKEAAETESDDEEDDDEKEIEIEDDDEIEIEEEEEEIEIEDDDEIEIEEEEKVEEKSEFKVVMTNCGSRKLDVIKILRKYNPSLSLTKAKEIADGQSSATVKEAATKPAAEKIKKELEAAGAKVKLMPLAKKEEEEIEIEIEEEEEEIEVEEKKEVKEEKPKAEEQKQEQKENKAPSEKPEPSASDVRVGCVFVIILLAIIALVIYFVAFGNSSSDAFTDPRDKKSYKTVAIGKQTWMAENLNFEMEGSECYEGKTANCKRLGRLYNWKTAMKACPKGWHLPAKAEIHVLESAVGDSSMAGEKLKATSGWAGNGNGTDNHGFAALPAGNYGLSAMPASGNPQDGEFVFSYYDDLATFWSATEIDANTAWSWWLINQDAVSRVGSKYKFGMRSARCVKD